MTTKPLEPSPPPAGPAGEIPGEAPQDLPWLDELTPRQIVAELDKYIIGQDEAKKAVAIVLRNRWRRQRVAEEMQKMAAQVKKQNPFQWLVRQAEQMFERVVGHSIVPDMVSQVLAWLQKLSSSRTMQSLILSMPLPPTASG